MQPLMIDFFRIDVLVKWSYIKLEWCMNAIVHPAKKMSSPMTAGSGTGFM